MPHEDPVAALQASDLMDDAWYVARYPDVAQGSLSPAQHYLRYGARMGRDPGPKFASRLYLQAYPDVGRTGMNPLIHYLRFGRDEQRQPRPDPTMVGLRQVARARVKLLTLGITDTGLAEMEAVAAQNAAPIARATALRELALWQMRTRMPAGYAAALPLLSRAHDGAPDAGFRSTLTVSQLLCLGETGARADGIALFDRAAIAGLVTPDVLLARTTLETTPEDRLPWVNRALDRYGIPPLTLSAEGATSYDRLAARDMPPPAPEAGPRVTVLVAAHAAADMLPTTLRGLTEQTWRNLEILVLDDFSPDTTVAVAREHAARDSRIKVIEMPANGGAYVARNHGLACATGDFVTLNDADDWSHPLKIETQVRHLMANPHVVACTSQQARMREDLSFSRWTGRGAFIIRNTSSLMFRRAPVRDRLGAWDTVRFAADSEMIRRMQRVFGPEAIVDLPTGPLSFQRDGDTSIVADPVRGMNGFYYGVRKEYFDAQRYHHARGGSGDGDMDHLKYDGESRPFPVPPMMRPDRPDPQAEVLFDLVLAGDFRAPGPVLDRALDLVQREVAAGRRTGLIETSDDPLQQATRIHDSLRSVIDGDLCRVIVWGERAVCRRLEHLSGRMNTRYIPPLDVRPGS